MSTQELHLIVVRECTRTVNTPHTYLRFSPLNHLKLEQIGVLFSKSVNIYIFGNFLGFFQHTERLTRFIYAGYIEGAR
jgi:hypothetical protein